MNATRRSSRLIRRIWQAGLATVCALGGVVVFGTAAFAHDLVISGTVSCATPAGSGYQITWTVSNNWNENEQSTVTQATGWPSNSTVSPTSFSIAASGNGSGGAATGPLQTATVHQTLASSYSGTATITIKGYWTPDDYTNSDQGSVTLPGNCTPTTTTAAPSSPTTTVPPGSPATTVAPGTPATPSICTGASGASSGNSSSGTHGANGCSGSTATPSTSTSSCSGGSGAGSGSSASGSTSGASGCSTPSSPAPAAAVSAPSAAVPGIAIVKRERIGTRGSYGRDTLHANLGQLLAYQIVVSNTGNTDLTLNLRDPHCDAGTITPAHSVTISPGTDAVYHCSHLLVSVPSRGIFHNVAVATGKSPQGVTVGPVRSEVLAKVSAPALRVKTLKVAQPAKPALRAAKFTG